MNELKKVTQIVKRLLEEDKQARNSDSYLYLKVLEYVAQNNDIDLQDFTVPVFLKSMNDLPFPGFETVRRSRQKIQATCPELAACDKVKDLRFLNECAYRDYARGGLV